MLNLKKCLLKSLTVTKATFTPTAGESYDAYGGCYYEQLGRIMHIHVGVSGLTANTNTIIYNMPLGKRPATLISTCGQGAGSNQLAYLSITDSGNVRVNSSGAYCAGDLYYMI